MLKKLTTLKVDDNQLTSLPNTIGRWVAAHTHSISRQEVTTCTFTLCTTQIQVPVHPSAAVFLGHAHLKQTCFMMIGLCSSRHSFPFPINLDCTLLRDFDSDNVQHCDCAAQLSVASAMLYLLTALWENTDWQYFDWERCSVPEHEHESGDLD